MVWTAPPDRGVIRYRLSCRTVAGIAIVAHGALLSPTFLAVVTAHGAQCCALSLTYGDIVIAAYWAVFLSCRYPVGTAVEAHSVILSHRSATVSTVDVVKIFVI